MASYGKKRTSIRSTPSNDAYRDGWDKAFGERPRCAVCGAIAIWGEERVLPFGGGTETTGDCFCDAHVPLSMNLTRLHPRL
jgi:hypothetical protein